MQTAMMVVNTLKELNIISISFRIVLAVICGGVIGAERGRAHQPAGMHGFASGYLPGICGYLSPFAHAGPAAYGAQRPGENLPDARHGQTPAGPGPQCADAQRLPLSGPGPQGILFP